MKWLKNNWPNIVLTVLATKLFEGLFAQVDINWRAPFSVLKSDPSFQAATLGFLLPVLFLCLFARRWEFRAMVSDAFATLVLGGLVIGYLLPFMFALMSGNIEPLVADMRQDPFSKVVLFMFIVVWIGKDILKTIISGQSVTGPDGEPKRRMPRPSDID